jgi:hypothetical protein
VDTAGDERGLHDIKTRGLLNDIPNKECIDDFMMYLFNDSVRQAVRQRFIDVVRPLLAAGQDVDVISHSWGTVVAYEALHTMDGQAEQLSGRVRNLFTVGSALSISEVKRRLDPGASGQRPALVDHWVNLNARFDIVGGHLMGDPFAVDEEYLGLKPVGCRTFIPDPVCSHSSYFNADNLAVNRDIFGRLISRQRP